MVAHPPKAGVKSPVPADRSEIDALDAEAPRQQRETLMAHASLWSPLANTLHNPVHLDVVLA